MRAKYAALDIETTGLDPATCQVLELAVVVETDWRTPPAELPRLHVLVEHEVIRGQPYALNMNARIIAELALPARFRFAQSVRAGDVPRVVRNFLDGHFESGRRVTLAGKNVATFDLRFLERIEGWPADRFRHRVLDVGSLWFDPAVDEALPETDRCMARAGVTNATPHHALGDCYATIEMIRAKFANVEAAS